MNKNYQSNKSSQTQSIFKEKTALGNKPEKNKNFQKSKNTTKITDNKNIKIQNKFRIKHQNRAKINNINNNQNKNNNKTHSKSKSQSRSNIPKQNKLSSGKNKEKISNSSNKVKSSNQTDKNEKNNKINIFPQPLPISLDKIKSDINNISFGHESRVIKLDIQKISKKTKEEILKNTTQKYENLNFSSLNDISSLFTAWQNISNIYRVFEEKLLKKNNFEIDKKTLEIRTKNADSCKELNDQKFWILYSEYLINNNLLVNEKQFLSVINEAFSYMDNDCAQLRIYYLEKIKKYSPCFLPDGSFDDSDDTYLNKLNKSTVNFIKNQKGDAASNVNLKSTNKKYYKIYEDIDNIKIELNDENKSMNVINKTDNEKCIGDKDITGDGEDEFEIIENTEK